jgi:hypothetical protein
MEVLMEETASTHPQPTPPTAAPQATRRDRNIGLSCAILLLIGMPIGYLPGSTGDAIGLVVLSLVSLALMAFFILRLVPLQRAAAPDRAARTALILGVAAVVTGVLFWTGIPFALGAGALALGLPLRESAAPEARGKSTAAVVLGAIAVAASFLLLLFG